MSLRASILNNKFFAIVPKIAGIVVFIRFMKYLLKIFNHGTNNNFIYCFNDFRSCSRYRSKEYKKTYSLQFYRHIGYALAGIATELHQDSSSVLYITIYAVMNLGIFGCIFLMKKDGKYTEEINDLSGISKSSTYFTFLIILFH